jgi:hypothetical protein
LHLGPDFVIELRSSSDRLPDPQEKMAEGIAKLTRAFSALAQAEAICQSRT